MIHARQRFYINLYCMLIALKASNDELFKIVILLNEKQLPSWKNANFRCLKFLQKTLNFNDFLNLNL